MKTTLSLLVIVSLLFFAACSGGGGGGQADCADLAAKLQSCNLMTAGDVNCDNFGDDPETLCNFGCIGKASCSEIEDLICFDEASSSLQACYLDCYERYQFQCDDGSDSVPSSWVCDGEDDCADGSDEDGCLYFECDDGSDVIEWGWVCDGYNDCADGSDEVDCQFFTCDDGLEEVSLAAVCDFYEDCSDGSDEAGCAQLVCPEE